MTLLTNKTSSRPKWESMTEEMAEVLRGKTGAERLGMAFQMWKFAYRLVSQSVKDQHPAWSEDQIREEVARRMSHGAI